MNLRNPFLIRRSEGTVPTLAVGGSPIPPPAEPLRTYRCPEPGCPVVDRDPSVTFAHAISQHQRGAA